MAIPEKTVLYHEKNILDRAIDNVLGQNKSLTASDLNQVIVAAQVQAGIDRYRAAAESLSINALVNEEHDSTRLGKHLEQTGFKRPPRCHAHALVAGKHMYAAVLRLIMASLKIRIDDPDNGCWLPEKLQQRLIRSFLEPYHIAAYIGTTIISGFIRVYRDWKMQTLFEQT